jgi:predicted nucleotidyltransferase
MNNGSWVSTGSVKGSSMDELAITKKIVQVIRSVKEPSKIVLFGSRAEGISRKTSDIDIAVFGKDWTDRDLGKARFLLEEEVKTPLKFDLLHFEAVQNDRLKQNIKKKGRVLYESGKN